MKGNRKIKLIIIIFVAANIFLLASAIILSHRRAKKIDLILYDALTSENFTRYASDGQYDDFTEYKDSFVVNDNADEEQVSNIEQFHDKFFEKGVKWVDILSISLSLGGEMPNVFVEPSYIIKLINLEKTLKINKVKEGEFGFEMTGGLENGIELYYGKRSITSIIATANIFISGLIEVAQSVGTDTTLLEGVNNLLKLVSTKLTNSFIYQGLNFFTYDDIFIANGEVIDSTDGLDKTEISNIENISNKEARVFADSIVITLQLRDRGNEWLNYGTSQFLNSFGGNELFIWNNGIRNLSRNYDKNTRYQTYEVNKVGLINKKYEITPKTKTKWSLKQEEILFGEKIESSWEQLLWAVYSEVDYTWYLDNALEADDKDSYTITDYYSMDSDLPIEFSTVFTEMGSEITNDLWVKGDDQTSFSNFVILCNLYRPFIRTDNIDPFLKEISKMASDGLKASDLLKPGQI